MPSVHLLISGKVQGVFFRASARNLARELGLRGWIRNNEEGKVESMATGESEALQLFVEWCRSGPPDAEVTEVEVIPAEEEEHGAFEIIR